MENKMLNKSKIDFLVESINLENQAKTEIASAKKYIAEEVNLYEDEDPELSMIQLRNNSIIKELMIDENCECLTNFLKEVTEKCSIDKKCSLSEAAKMASIFSVVLDENVSIEDIYDLAKSVDKDGSSSVTNINYDLVNNFRESYERSFDICKLCLEDATMFDADSLKTYLPKLLAVNMWF